MTAVVAVKLVDHYVVERPLVPEVSALWLRANFMQMAREVFGVAAHGDVQFVVVYDETTPNIAHDSSVTERLPVPVPRIAATF